MNKIIKHGDKLEITDPCKPLPTYATAYTIMGYAAQYDEDPIEALNEAKSNNDEITAIILDGSSISATSQRKVIRVKVSVGDTVRIEGNDFNILPANNGNYRFGSISE